MKKRIELMEAKKVLDSDKVFLNGSNITYACYGKYSPNLTFVLPLDWNIDSKGNFETPIIWRKYPEIIKNMNVDFNGETKGMFGDYWISKNGKPCFKITSPQNAKYILIVSSWGGCFNSTRGQWDDYAKEVGAKFFRKASSNGGGAGCDYWVLPVGFVADFDTREVSSILAGYAKKEEERILEMEREYAALLSRIEESKRAKEKYMDRLLAIADYYKNHCTYTSFEMFDDGYRVAKGSLNYYTEENILYLEKRVEEMKDLEMRKEKFLPLFHEYDSLCEAVGLKLIEYSDSVYLGEKCFRYTEEGLGNFIDYLLLVQKRKVEEEKERRRKLLEAQILAKKLEDERLAKEAGYPSDFSFWKHDFGATGNSRAFVIRPDGTLRERDSIDQSNKNRLHRYDEGYELWHQILPEELVITYKKQCTREPYICEVFFRPEVVTEAQKEKIIEIQSQLSINVQGKKGLISGIESPLCEGWDV